MSNALLTPPVIARTLPFLLYVVFLPLVDVVGRLAPGLDLRWLYGLQVGLAGAALLYYRRRYVELAGAGLPSAASIGAAALVGALVFVLWINLALPYLSFQTGSGFDPRGQGGIIVALAVLRVAGAALVVPVMEELFWRSFVMRWIDRHDFLALPPLAVSLRALALSSLLFGLEHGLWFAGILAGLAYGELYRRCGTLWAPIVAHAVTNALLGGWVLHTGNWSFW